MDRAQTILQDMHLWQQICDQLDEKCLSENLREAEGEGEGAGGVETERDLIINEVNLCIMVSDRDIVTVQPPINLSAGKACH